MQAGEYCGLGCLGDACLYYQIGCFHGCASCSLQGKTLYPVPNDLKLARCNESSMPKPSLGGGNKTLEHILRSYNIDDESVMGDWTQWMPWRSPGHAGRGNPDFQPCGVNSGALASQPEPPTTAKDVPNGGPGTSLPPLPKHEWAVWKAGSVVEAEWAIYANHAGGYSYRLCKKEAGKAATEACYQKTPLKFATAETEIRYKDGSQKPFKIVSPTTDVGTFPAGSQWRKNPVPMCNCDIGLGCTDKDHQHDEETAAKAWAHFEAAMKRRRLGGECKPDPTCKEEPYACKECETDPTKPSWSCKVCCPACEAEHKDGGTYCACGKPGPTPAPAPTPAKGKCHPDPTCKKEAYACKECADSPAWSCKVCCPGCEPEEKDGGTYCNCGKGPSPSPGPKRNTMFKAYKNTHFRPGQTNKLCPTGVQFPTLFDGGAGAGYKSNGGSVPAGGHGGVGFGNFDFTMVDKLKVPDVPPGEYSVSWRWDCEETPQVWNSCADVMITA